MDEVSTLRGIGEAQCNWRASFTELVRGTIARATPGQRKIVRATVLLSRAGRDNFDRDR
jgi:hypothetical protein